MIVRDDDKAPFVETEILNNVFAVLDAAETDMRSGNTNTQNTIKCI